MMIMIFPDPGVGPVLHYSTHQDHVELTCEVEDVFPQPSLALRWTLEGGAPNITKRELRYNIVRLEETRFYKCNPVLLLAYISKQTTNFAFNNTISLFIFSIHKQCVFFRYFSDKARTMTIRRQMHYSVTVQAKLSTISLLPETVFTCTMVIPGTSLYLVKKMMYYVSTMVAPRTSMVGSAEHLTVWGWVLGLSVGFRLF